MDTSAIIGATFEVQPDVVLEFLDSIEVSLDCPVCLRTRRTIVFNSEEDDALCTPTRHPFPGLIEEKHVQQTAEGVTVQYTIRYATASFTDPKYHEPSIRHPDWGRIHYRYRCPQCQAQGKGSVQNNLVRPRSARCNCGFILYEDKKEIPWFRAFNIEGRLLHEQTMSQITLYVWSSDSIAHVTKTLLEDLSGKRWSEIQQDIELGRPVYVQDSYTIKDPVAFSSQLQAAAFALLGDNAHFDVFGNGRSIKMSYMHRLKETGG